MTRIAFAVLLCISCASDYSRRMPPADDPADPSAPASAPARVALYETAPAETTAPPHVHDAGTPAVVYTCPMHPEVQQATPGQCPKCGMKLVPRSGP